MRSPRHILLVTARDWRDARAQDTEATLEAQVTRWLDWGHRVTVLCGGGASGERGRREQPREGLTIRRVGRGPLVPLRAMLACWRGIGRDADVVLEVLDGAPRFLTPLWWFCAAPLVTLVPHPQPPSGTGLRARGAALIDRLALAALYRQHPFLTSSHAAVDWLVAQGVAHEQIHTAYPGVEPVAFHDGERDPLPTLVHVGQLVADRRLEVLLDIVAELPGTHLRIAGDGSHRRALTGEIGRRGLTDRVTLLGAVEPGARPELYARSWLNLAGSAHDGSSRTVLEAAAARTPSAGLTVGTLPESIVHGQTGLLADTPGGLAGEIAALLADPARHAALADNARARARGFSWDRTAAANLAVLDATAEAGRPRLRDALRRSETGAAAGLAAATLVNNLIQLVFTIVFTRLLGADGYGALAAIISAFLILMVAGQAIQVAAAREATLGHLGDPAQLHRTLRSWTIRLVVATVALGALCVPLREPLGHLLGVPEHPWAAAAILPTGAIWLLLSLQRGALQGLRDYAAVGGSIVGEALGRILTGLVLVGAGLGVTGAYLGTPLAFALVAIVLGGILARRLGPPAVASGHARPLLSLIGDNWLPIGGLLLLAVLQNIDVIIGRHVFDGDRAGSYAVAAVAAKSVVWVAIGVGLQLLPEATRRAASGLDPRPTLLRALGVLAIVAAPALLIFAVVGEPLLRIAFGGEELAQASDALPVLGLAMTLLAVTYLTVQYLVALGELRFVWVLGVAAVVEPLALLLPDLGLTEFATVVLLVQVGAASAILGLGLRTRRATGHAHRSEPNTR